MSRIDNSSVLSETLNLKDEISFKNANDILKLIKSIKSDHLLINISALSYCDSAGISVLLEAKKYFLADNRKVDFVDVKKNILDLSSFLKVDTILFNTAKNNEGT